MRILYHHRTLADGAEGVHIAAIVDAFRALGHDVRVLGVDPAAPSQKRTVVHGVRSMLPAAAFEAASLALNAPDYLHLRREIASFRPDLIYKRHARYDVAAMEAAHHRRVPTVLEVNTVFSAAEYARFEPMALHRMARALERRCFEIATLVAAVSSPLSRQITAAAPRANVMTVPNGADPVRFDPAGTQPEVVRARHGIAADALVVGWTGILREWHGLELLLDAMRALPGVVLLLVGDGPARPTIERRAADSGLAGRVVITGRVAHAAVRDYIAAMDVAVVAGERTGIASPMKLLEYMSMARAVAAPAMDNIRDLVEDGHDGVLFPSGDAGALAAVIGRLAGDRDYRLSLGRAARLKVETQRNWRQIARDVLTRLSASTNSVQDRPRNAASSGLR